VGDGPQEEAPLEPAEASRGLSAALPYVYVGAFLLAAVGWWIYASVAGLNPAGFLYTAVLGVGPLVLLCEGVRQLYVGRWPQGALLLLIFAVLAGLILSGAIVRAILFPADRARMHSAEVLTRMGLERVDYASPDGALVGLAGRAPEGKRRAVAIYFHGNAESAARNTETALALARAGVDVLVAEFRGYGSCPGSPSEEGLLIDGEAAVAEACQRFGVERSELVLIGRSLGSGVAAGLAGRGVGRRVVLLSPYTSIQDMVSRMVPRPLAHLACRDPFDSRASLLLSSQPVLVIHGERDRVIPAVLGKNLASSLGKKRCKLLLFPNAGHNDLFALEGRAVFEAMVSFATTP
jgi:alpha-beta hydrolase superfamily lysophospholipase